MQIGWGGIVFTRLDKAEERDGGDDASAITSSSPGSSAGSSAKEGSDGGGGGGSSSGGTSSSLRRRKATGAEKETDKPKSRGGGGAGGEGSGADQALATMRYDRMAIAYLSLLLLPLVVGYSAKKLVMDEHAGWYSWALQSVTVSKAARAAWFFFFRLSIFCTWGRRGMGVCGVGHHRRTAFFCVGTCVFRCGDWRDLTNQKLNSWTCVFLWVAMVMTGLALHILNVRYLSVSPASTTRPCALV